MDSLDGGTATVMSADSSRPSDSASAASSGNQLATAGVSPREDIQEELSESNTHTKGAVDSVKLEQQPSTTNGTKPSSSSQQSSPRPASKANSTNQQIASNGSRRQLGEWTLGKTLGAGSMGKVKLAVSIETGEKVKNRAFK